ncbi:MAG: hypothetical protein R3E53_12200 [Myxococcota bacterium]
MRGARVGARSTSCLRRRGSSGEPEPTSVENAYTLLQLAFYRRMRLAMVGHGVRQLVTLAMDQRNERGIRTPLDLLREIEATDSAEARRFVETMRVFRPRLIVNGVRTAEDVKLGFAVSSVCKKYFGIEAEYLGYVNYDDEARRSVSQRRPIVDLRGDADVSIYLQRIARKLIGRLLGGVDDGRECRGGASRMGRGLRLRTPKPPPGGGCG